MQSETPHVVLITGGAGYLGQTLINHLIQTGNQQQLELISLDIRAGEQKEVTFITADIRDKHLASTLKENHVRTVVHLAAVVNAGGKIPNEVVYDIDVNGTKNLLEASVEAGVEHIIVASSGAAYGYWPDSPAQLTEIDPVRGNETLPYSHHKRLVEEMLESYRNQHPTLKQTVFRIATILGETTRNQITDLFDKKRPLLIGKSSRPFTFIYEKDLAACLAQAIERPKPGIYNVTGDGTLTMTQIAEIQGKSCLNVSAKLVKFVLSIFHPLRLSQYAPEEIGFVQYRPVMSNKKLKQTFGFIPQVSTEEAFRRYLKSRDGV